MRTTLATGANDMMFLIKKALTRLVYHLLYRGLAFSLHLACHQYFLLVSSSQDQQRNSPLLQAKTREVIMTITMANIQNCPENSTALGFSKILINFFFFY